MQQTTIRQHNGVNPVSLLEGTSSYTLLIDGDPSRPPEEGQQFITAGSVEDAAKYLVMLGEGCKLYISPEYQRDNPELKRRISDQARSLEGPGAPFDTEVAERLMGSLPFDMNGLVRSPIAIMPPDPAPRLIRKEIVHKHKEANVLISEPYRTGWIRYFNMYQETEELSFDHPSDHVQGMLMLEALRQAGIASAHLQGLPADGMLALMEYRTKFTHFLFCGAPIVLRTYCSFTADESSSDMDACIYLQVMQWGRVCAESHLKAFACMNGDRCRIKEERIERIAMRQKNQFEWKHAKTLEMEKAG